MIDRWLLSYRARPIDLAVFRIVYCVVMAGVYVPRGTWLGSMPDIAYMPPPGLAVFFSGFPPGEVALTLNLAACVSLAFLLVGAGTVVVSFSLAASLITLNSFVYSTGKIDHMILVDVLPAVMAFSGWGRCLRIGGSREPAPTESRPCWPLAIWGLSIGVAMFTAAWAKVATGWLDPHSRAVRGHYTANLMMSDREPLVTPVLERLPDWAWELQDYASVLLEFAVLPAVLVPGVFRVVLALTSIFHLAVWLTFAIPFWTNILAYVPFFGGWRDRDVTIARPALFVASAVCVFLGTRDVPLAPAWVEGLLVLIGAAIATGWLVRAGLAQMRRRRALRLRTV